MRPFMTQWLVAGRWVMGVPAGTPRRRSQLDKERAAVGDWSMWPRAPGATAAMRAAPGQSLVGSSHRSAEEAGPRLLSPFSVKEVEVQGVMKGLVQFWTWNQIWAFPILSERTLKPTQVRGFGSNGRSIWLWASGTHCTELAALGGGGYKLA